ncbi:MAG: tetratricopeptide repeat protein [candidate division WOR-3 bacterium]
MSFGVIGRSLRCQANLFFLLLLISSNCAYFNLFYNAKTLFKEGEKLSDVQPTQSKEKFSKAKEKSLLLIKKYPRSRYVPSALFLAALCHYRLQEYDKAKNLFSLFLSLYPKAKLTPKARYYYALSHIRTDDFTEGILLLRALAEEDKREERKIRWTIYSSLIEKGEAALAAESLKRFIENNPKSKEGKESKFLLAQANFLLGNYRESKRYYEEYLSGVVDKKKKAHILLKIGECLLRYENQPETLRRFINQVSWVLENYPELKNETNLLRGKILFALGEEKSALATLREVRGGKEGAESYFLIGEYYERNGDFHNSLIYYDTTLIFSAESEFSGSARKKKRLIEKLTQEESLPPAARDFARAELYLLSLGEPDSAFQKYEKVFTQYPEDSLAPKSLFAAAWIKKFILKNEDGNRLFQKLIQTYPQTEYAREGEKLLNIKE